MAIRDHRQRSKLFQILLYCIRSMFLSSDVQVGTQASKNFKACLIKPQRFDILSLEMRRGGVLQIWITVCN
jgi:hypothetical protein